MPGGGKRHACAGARRAKGMRQGTHGVSYAGCPQIVYQGNWLSEALNPVHRACSTLSP